MNIRKQISFIVLPLIIVPLVLTGLAASFAARNGITQVTTEFLRFKAENLLNYAGNQWSLLSENNLNSDNEYISVSKSAVQSFAQSLVRDPSERIFALNDQGGIELSSGDIELADEERIALVSIVKNGKTGWMKITVGGVPRVAHVVRFDPFRWTIFVTQAEEVFYNTINQIYLQTGLILSISLVIAVVLLVVFTGHLTRPLRNIAQAMNDIIISNDLSKKVDILYRDETGDLAHAFNLMTGELQKAYEQIKIYALETAISQKKEEKIRHIFQKYVPKDVIDRFMHEPESMLIGEDRLLAVLFSDIRQFTTISEMMKPKDIVESLNKYFGTMVNIIIEHGGIVDKYIGDAIMAFYGAPVRHENDAYDALESGFEMLESLKGFNDWQKERSGPEFKIGIGINYGIVTVGNIGSDQKMDYTVIGDSVNLTSRLENLTKKYKEPLLISEAMYREVVHKVPCRMIDRVTVKGKTEEMGIYTARKSLSREEETAWKLHHAGLHSYYYKQFEEAKIYFGKVLEILPDDPTAAMFLLRCEDLIKSPPGADWDGVVVLIEK